MENKTLGQKIEYYRKRAKMSQLDLEIEIGAGQGSISRIENGQVNPTKETLSKIANVLKLKPSEVSNLLGLNILSTEELILAIQSLSASLDLNTTLQTAVDIMFDLFPFYNGGIVFLKDDINGNTFRARTISSQIPQLDNFLKLLPFKLDQIVVDLNKHNNFAVQTILNNKIYQSEDLYDFSRDVVTEFISDSIQKISNCHRAITIPMVYEGNVIGMILFTKRVKDVFSDKEIRLLELLTYQIGIAIINAKKYEDLKQENELLRKEYDRR